MGYLGILDYVYLLVHMSGGRWIIALLLLSILLDARLPIHAVSLLRALLGLLLLNLQLILLLLLLLELVH